MREPITPAMMKKRAERLKENGIFLKGKKIVKKDENEKEQSKRI